MIQLSIFISNLQLTNITYEDAVSMLSQIVGHIENNTAMQTSEALDEISSYFNVLADFVTKSDVMINATVSICILLTVSCGRYYIHNTTLLLNNNSLLRMLFVW